MKDCEGDCFAYAISVPDDGMSIFEHLEHIDNGWVLSPRYEDGTMPVFNRKESASLFIEKRMSGNPDALIIGLSQERTEAFLSDNSAVFVD